MLYIIYYILYVTYYIVYIISKTAGALVRHRACIVPLWLVSGYWCSVIAIPVT